MRVQFVLVVDRRRLTITAYARLGKFAATIRATVAGINRAFPVVI